VTVHYLDPDGSTHDYPRAAEELPPEPKEIKPHPYGVELGRLMTMLKASPPCTISAFLCDNFSRVSSSVAKKICDTAKVSTRASTTKIGRHEADALYQAIQNTKIAAPATDCISPIGEQLLLKGLHHVVPAEFYVAATRPPSVYRGNPFLVEAALAYGGTSASVRVPLETLTEKCWPKAMPARCGSF
jgi:DNA topoisomerase-6 subunit B